MTTQELTAACRITEKTLASHAERLDDHKERIVVNERAIKEQGQMMLAIQRLTLGIETLTKSMCEMGVKVDGIGHRIGVLELEPGVKWKTVTGDIIKIIIAAGIGYSLAQIGLK